MSEINGERGDSGESPVYTLLLYLAGPMQAWGSRSRFDDRDTHLEPTRSGLLGLLCCSFGIHRENTAALERLNSGISLIGVRVDAPGRIARDYHTARRVINAAGKGESTVVSTRHYLADARFLVALQSSNRDLLAEVRDALRSPVWSLFLGRKSFPVTLPPILPGRWGEICEGTAESILQNAPWYVLKANWQGKPLERAPTQLRVVLESEDGPNIQADVPLDFGQRRFSLRRFKNKYYPCPTEEVHPCLNPYWKPA